MPLGVHDISQLRRGIARVETNAMNEVKLNSDGASIIWVTFNNRSSCLSSGVSF